MKKFFLISLATSMCVVIHAQQSGGQSPAAPATGGRLVVPTAPPGSPQVGANPTGQPTEPPRAQPPPPGTEPARAPGLPPGRATPIHPGGRTFNLTNGAVAVPGTSSTNSSTVTPGTIQPTNQFFNPVTNRFPPINPTNAFRGTQSSSIFALTNNLARMSPAQATNVTQFQAALTALQNDLVNLANVPNAPDIIRQDPQIQRQLADLSRQIKTLARTGYLPSDDLANRLSEDLVVILFPRWQLTPDRQLVLAMLINQAVNAGRLTQPQIEATSQDTLVTLQSAGIPLSRAYLIRGDLSAIMAEAQQQQQQ